MSSAQVAQGKCCKHKAFLVLYGLCKARMHGTVVKCTAAIVFPAEDCARDSKQTHLWNFQVSWTVVLSMGWKKVSTTPDTSGTFRRDLHQNNEGHQHDRASERRYRKRRNAMTICMMEDLLQAENFQSLLNIYATRRGSRSNVEWCFHSS